MTREKVRNLGLSVTEKEIHEPGVADELVALGGKRQMPFLIDSSRGVSMYEAHAIMDYLDEHYSATSQV
jgi:glutathione S-transferase